MNDTKWRELCLAFSAFEPPPHWRTRDLLTEHLSDWDSDWYHHLGPEYCSIEWLEIDPSRSTKEKIEEILVAVGVPFEFDQTFIVRGYQA